MSSTLPSCWAGELLPLDGQTEAVIFCKLQGLWVSMTLTYVTNPSVTSAIQDVIPYQHPSHCSQPPGFLTPCIASISTLLRQKQECASGSFLGLLTH
jgi:hypothetical protein